MYEKIYQEKPRKRFDDPRSVVERWLHRWLENTQPFYSHFRLPRTRRLYYQERITVRIASLIGW
jgi:hypothetical protein